MGDVSIWLYHEPGTITCYYITHPGGSLNSPGKLPNPAVRLDCQMRQYYPQCFTVGMFWI